MKFFTTLIFSFLVFSLSAQFTRTNYYEIFLGPGALVAFSDIGAYNPGFASNAGFRYRFAPHFAFKGNLVSGLITGTDEGSKNETRGIIFHTFLVEPTAQIEFFPFREKRGFDRRGHLVLKPVINPYIYGGLGCIYFIPSLDPESSYSGVMPDDYTRFSPVLNGGGGLIFIMNKRWSWNIEMGGRFLTTDCLDGYTSTASESKDLYYFATINVIYRIIPGPRRKK